MLMLAPFQTNIDAPPVVTLENFGKFVSWFGPVNENILNNVYDLCVKRWFHGRINKEQVSVFLEKNRKSFVIRLSESMEGNFVLSRTHSIYGIMHFRILYDQEKANYVITCDNHNNAFTSLDSLVSHYTNLWGLDHPTDGNILNMLMEDKTLGDYPDKNIFHMSTDSFATVYSGDIQLIPSQNGTEK